MISCCLRLRLLIVLISYAPVQPNFWGCATGAEQDIDVLPDWRVTEGYCLFDRNVEYLGSYSWRDGQLWNVAAAWGHRLDPSGAEMFQPLTDGLDILDNNTMSLRDRIAFGFYGRQCHECDGSPIGRREEATKIIKSRECTV